MTRLRRAVATLTALLIAPLAWSGDVPAPDAPGDAAATPPWSVAITLYPTHVHGGERYTSAIGIAERGPVHLEARVNYESVGARSAWLGWAFAGGGSVR